MPNIFVCLPVLDELEQIPQFLNSFSNQTISDFQLIVCVNQVDEWWEEEDKSHICENNQKSILLFKESNLSIEIIDRTTRGLGWTGKKRGVGWARKLCMDRASELAESDDLIVSVDADTIYPPDYLASLIPIFENHPQISALANPYYHALTSQHAEDKAILRYEIYMRIYLINMMLIENPYAFSAVGSAMVCTAKQYIKMGGISPKHSGEDFYFLQHFRKNKPLYHYNHVKVFPMARFSSRVNFGTGPAMIKGNTGDWTSYPFYLPEQFKQISETFSLFEKLYDKDIETPMTSFLQEQLKRKDIWGALRKNFKTKEKFINACFQLVDGLRILQFLKTKHIHISQGQEKDLVKNLEFFCAHDHDFKQFYEKWNKDFNFKTVEHSNSLRDALEILEMKYRKLKPIV